MQIAWVQFSAQELKKWLTKRFLHLLSTELLHPAGSIHTQPGRDLPGFSTLELFSQHCYNFSRWGSNPFMKRAQKCLTTIDISLKTTKNAGDTQEQHYWYKQCQIDFGSSNVFIQESSLK